jgi:hypothetical protein
MGSLNLNLSLLWAAVLTTLSGSLWLFTNIAWASDITAIEIRLIKQDIREIRREISMLESDEATLKYLEEELEILIDELCQLSPEDRECS